MSGFFDRCAQYTNVGANCEFVPDPKDPSCCQMPECYVTGTVNITSGNQLPTPAPSGTYIGQGIGLGMLGVGIRQRTGKRAVQIIITFLFVI